MNPKVDAFLQHAPAWREEMGALRAIALECGLTEELKWGKPCYTYEGSNLAIIIPFKASCALMFPKGALLSDPKKVLLKPTENTQGGRWIKFTRREEIARKRAVLKAYLREAIAAEKAGLKVAYRKTEDYPVPAELRQRWKQDPAFKAAFGALTPGRQRGYLLYFGAAKQAGTRVARIDKCAPQIFAGKGWNER